MVSSQSLISKSLSYSIVIFSSSLFSLSFSFILWSAGTAKSGFFVVVDNHSVWSSGRDEMIHLYLKTPERFMRFLFGRILGCAYTICSYGQMKSFCSIPCGAPCPLSRVLSDNIFALIYWIRLLCDWSFRVNHHIIYIFYFIMSCLFLLLFCLYGFILCCYEKRFCFSLKTYPSFLVWDFACISLEISTQLFLFRFFFYLFLSSWCSCFLYCVWWL